MLKKHCCNNCFSIQNNRVPFSKPSVGTCDFCGTTNTEIIEPRELQNLFELVVNIYEPDKNGKTLAELLKQDWHLFTHPKMDIAHAKDLLSEILDNGEVTRQPFSLSSNYRSEGLAQWESLRDELLHRNRWFLEKSIDATRLEQLLSLLYWDDLPSEWYRARITADANDFRIEDMGAPPPRLASHGRANPVGIPYLYLGSNPESAVAEVRPHTGEVACVARFSIPKIKVVDLRAPRGLVSPFILSDADQIGQLLADLPFLERLGEELTRPVLPKGAAIDYIPSQYLCEFIKMSGFDGVIYRSSVSDGINLALFDPNKAVGQSVSRYSVERVSVEVKVSHS